MVTKNDIIEVDGEKDWFSAGLDYGLISWTSTFNRMGKPNPYSRIEKIIVGLIAEQAIEKFLNDQAIEYETQGKTKWYEEDRYDIGLKGYAIDVKSSLLDTSSTFIQNKYSNLFEDKFSWFTKCSALVPMDQFNPGNNERRAHHRDKIYIFPFVEGHFSESASQKPFIHTFWDYRWLKRAEHKDDSNLGYLIIRQMGKVKNCALKIYGTSEPKNICVETIILDKPEVRTKNRFFQVFSIEFIGAVPENILKIESVKSHLIETIKPELSFSLERTTEGYWPVENNWQSLAFNDCKIYLLGWIGEDDFRVEGKEYPRFTHNIEQYAETKVDNWGCFVKSLNPMKDLKKVKNDRK